MDICHLKIAELQLQIQKYKGRVVLRGHIVNKSLWSLRSFYWTGLVCVPNDRRKSKGMLLQDYQIVTNKQLMQYLPTLK